MQKKLIALAVAGLMSSAAFAQSSVTIDGSLDAMFTSYTNDSDGVAMLGSANGHGDTTHKTNRLRFRGTQKVAHGLTAFFELEERFNLDTGAENTAQTNARFGRSSWVGLQGGFGKVWLGRVPTAGDLVFGGGKIGNNDTIADWASRKGSMADRQANGIAYQSPKFGPLTVNVSTAVAERNDAATPLGISAALNFGQFFVESAWQKDGANARSNTLRRESNINMFINGGVKIGKDYNIYAYIGKSKGYETYDFTGAPVGTSPNSKALRYAIGADAKLGNGKLFTNLGVARTETTTSFDGDRKYTALNVAYQYDLSRTVKLIAAGSYERAGYMAGNTSGYASREQSNPHNNRLGVQAGLRVGF